MMYIRSLHTVYAFFFFKQKTAYEMRISDWSSDVCSSDLVGARGAVAAIVVVDRLNRHGLERTDRLPAPARARIKISHAVGQGGEEFVGPALELEPGGERSLEAGQRDPVVGAEYLRSDEHTPELPSLMRNAYAVL